MGVFSTVSRHVRCGRCKASRRGGSPAGRDTQGVAMSGRKRAGGR
jgi:hypothetical protein